jgi:outer membrane lipoprotein
MATRMSSSASVWGLSSRALLLAALVLALGACATAPITPEIEGQAMSVVFSDLAANPDQFKGQTVILGGQVIKAVPAPEGTVLTVLQTKTEGDERPEGPETSQGRFMAVSKGFLDPQIYAPGRQVTVAGTVAGKRVEKLGEIDYPYPLIEADQVYLWPRSEPRYYAPYWGPYWPWGSAYYGPYGYWGPWWW